MELTQRLLAFSQRLLPQSLLSRTETECRQVRLDSFVEGEDGSTADSGYRDFSVLCAKKPVKSRITDHVIRFEAVIWDSVLCKSMPRWRSGFRRMECVTPRADFLKRRVL
jgi:hypothetical protein